MTTYLLYIIISFLCSAVCGFVFIPLIISFCKRKGLYDLPDERKLHHSNIPRLGGISFLPSMFLAALAALALNNHFANDDQMTISLWSAYFAISLLLIYGVGLVDDLVGLEATPKFVVQIIAAVLMPAAGLYFNNLYGMLGIYEIGYWPGALFTVFVIVFISNAFNLIDGIDGLSGSLSFLALGGFLVCFIHQEMLIYCILIAGLMGVLVPFLYYNIWGKAEKGQKIFMGDAGSLTLGFILGFLAVKYSMNNPNVMPYRPYSMLLAYTLLVVPVFDVVRVSILRIRHHKPIFDADKNHIHHKLLRTGMNQHWTLVTILLLAVTFIALNVALAHVVDSMLIVLIDIAVWMLFHAAINLAIHRNGQEVFILRSKASAHD